MKTIYDLKLHEILNIQLDKIVTRVPGGWIYCIPNNNEQNITYNSVFVPYNNEFEGGKYQKEETK